jgi:zinc protease
MGTPARLALFLALLLRAASAAPLPAAAQPLAPDPAARFGALPNGIRYVVLPNREPRGRAALRLLVLSGSLEEREDQRGLAHFLEHMAFNGSTHYAPGTLVEYFQRMGMSFGGDTNAYTSFDRTVYKIELPNTRPETVAEGLRVFADFAGGLLLDPAMIRKERPIILSEKRDRDSVEYREFVSSFQFHLADSLLPRRLPIGLSPVIETACRDRFRDLYDAWYRPGRMIVVVVGDVDPTATEGRIAAAFGGVRDRAPARPDPSLGQVTAALGLRTGYHHEPEAPATTITIDVVLPYARVPDTPALRLGHLRRDLALAMLNRRLDILSRKEGAPFIRAWAEVEESFNFVHDASVGIQCAPGQWRAALAVGEQELRRALRFGFTAAELAEARANLRNTLEQAVATAATRRSDDLAGELVETLALGRVFTHPSQDLALLGPALERETPGDCAAALRLAFAGPGRYVFVSGNAAIPGNAEGEIAAAYASSRAVAVRPPEAPRDGAFAYADFGPPGRVVSRRLVGDLGLTEAVFANGVRANVKRTDFEAHRVHVSVRVGSGSLTQRRDEPGISFFTDITFAAGGLGRHSADDLERILAGRTLGLEFRVGADALSFGGVTNDADLRLQLALFAAYITDPGYRPEAMRVAGKAIEEMYNELDHVPEGPLQARVPALLASGDPRFGLPSRAEMLGRNLAQERGFLAPQLASGPIEVGIVGDVDPDAALASVAATLGALPPRASKPSYAAERVVRFPSKPFNLALEVPSEIPKAVVALYWPTADASDAHRTRRLSLLASILDDRLRLRIREQLGGAYSPEAFSEPSDTFTGYGMIAAEVLVAPERADEIVRAVRQVAADLCAGGVTPDELERARKPALTAIHESARTNTYWLGAVLASCQEFPRRLEWARTRQADVESVTPTEISALAKAYLGPEKAFQVTVRPR